MTKTIKLTCFLLLCYQILSAQTDNEFWFAVPDVTSTQNLDRPVYLRLVTHEQAATVVVSQPANTNSFPTQTITIAANSLYTINLSNWVDVLECKPANTILNNGGLHIQSNVPISAYYEVNGSNLNPEIFVLKGSNALGQSFVISSQNFCNNNGNYATLPYSSFDIVTTENNTTVTIIPSKNIVGHTANNAFTINLNKGQCYSATAQSQLASQHLEGSLVNANHPIAITLKDDNIVNPTYGGCSDMIGDQTVPVTLVGKKYIAISGNLNNPGDQVFITAIQNNTQIFKNGILQYILNANQTYQTNINGASCFIETSNPSYVYHVTGIGCEFGASILPSIECTGSYAVTMARSSSEPLYITLLVESGGIGNFSINGNTTFINASQFSAVPGTANQWYFAKISLPTSSYPAGTTIRINNSTNLFHEGSLNGDVVSGASVGYFSDYNSVITPHIFTTNGDTVICFGGTLQLSSNFNGTQQWAGPNGFSSNSHNVNITNNTPANSGYYSLTATVPGCGTGKDSVFITVLPLIDVHAMQSICYGSSYLGHNQAGNYIDTLTSMQGCDSIIHLSLNINPILEGDTAITICSGQTQWGHSLSGNYTDTIALANGCKKKYQLTLTVNPPIEADTFVNICEGHSFLTHTQSGTYDETFQTAEGCDSIVHLNLIVNPPLTQDTLVTICSQDFYFAGGKLRNEAGIYTDTIRNADSCHVVVFTHLQIISTPAICECSMLMPNAFTPNGDQLNDVFKLTTNHRCNLENYSFSIYNRAGQRVYYTSDPEMGWNGTIRNQYADIGTYFFFVSYTIDVAGLKNHVTKKGDLTLIR